MTKTKITVGLIVSWIAGVLFTLTGFGVIASGSVFLGIIVVVLSLLIIPYVSKIMDDKWGIHLSSGVKWLIFLIVLGMISFAPLSSLDTSNVPKPEPPSVVSSDSTEVNQEIPAVSNSRQDYTKFVKIEELSVGEGYGEWDIPGFDSPKPMVTGKIRNTGDRTLETVIITIYFLDSNGNRIGEEEYWPVDADSFLSEDEILKPNYVRDFGYIVQSDAPSDWSGKVEAELTNIFFVD